MLLSIAKIYLFLSILKIGFFFLESRINHVRSHFVFSYLLYYIFFLLRVHVINSICFKKHLYHLLYILNFNLTLIFPHFNFVAFSNNYFTLSNSKIISYRVWAAIFWNIHYIIIIKDVRKCFFQKKLKFLNWNKLAHWRRNKTCIFIF